MKITDDDCAELQRLCKEHNSEITINQAREVLSSLNFLLERFGGWLREQQVAGRLSERGELQTKKGPETRD